MRYILKYLGLKVKCPNMPRFMVLFYFNKYIFREKMSLPGLPPLPKSLIAETNVVTTNDQQRGLTQSTRQATLDTQLAILRREMVRIYQKKWVSIVDKMLNFR